MSISMSWFGLVIGFTLGIIGSILYFAETRSKMYGRPSYVSHQVLIYPRILPASLLIIFIAALSKTPWNVYLISSGVLCIIIIVILLIIFTFLLRKGRAKVSAVPKGTLIRTDQDFIEYKSDLSGKTFYGTVSLNGIVYKAYQTVEPPVKPIRKNQNVVVESTDNYYLVVKPYNSCQV